MEDLKMLQRFFNNNDFDFFNNDVFFPSLFKNNKMDSIPPVNVSETENGYDIEVAAPGWLTSIKTSLQSPPRKNRRRRRATKNQAKTTARSLASRSSNARSRCLTTLTPKKSPATTPTASSNSKSLTAHKPPRNRLRSNNATTTFPLQ